MTFEHGKVTITLEEGILIDIQHAVLKEELEGEFDVKIFNDIEIFEEELKNHGIDIGFFDFMESDPHSTYKYGGLSLQQAFVPILAALIVDQDALNQPIQLLVLTGRNEKLYQGFGSYLTSKNIPVMCNLFSK